MLVAADAPGVVLAAVVVAGAAEVGKGLAGGLAPRLLPSPESELFELLFAWVICITLRFELPYGESERKGGTGDAHALRLGRPPQPSYT